MLLAREYWLKASVGLDQPAPAYFYNDQQDDLSKRNNLHCLYHQALGYMGIGDREKADSILDAIRNLDPAHLGACLHARLLKYSVL